MAQEVSQTDSILQSTKKILGIMPDYTEFDLDIIAHINTVFSDLSQLGIGPSDSFEIVDENATWDSYLDGNPKFNSVRTYMYLRVQSFFDPPTTSFHLDSRQKQIDKMEWRLSVERESTEWVDPNPPPVVIPDPFADE